MLKEILNKFLIIQGVQAAIVIEDNGEMIESMKSGIVIDRNLTDVIATVMLDSNDTAINFGNATLSMVFVEYSESFLILGPIADGFFLVVIAKNSANIGQITYEMKKNQDAIVSFL
jgi:predicted regulator of Ras-like GTPase activity (Roadblock/LC7/MglB family)